MKDATLEAELSTMFADRASAVPSTPLRRAVNPEYIEAARPTTKDASTLAAPAAEAGASSPQRDALLNTREQTHGSFADNARVSQALKRILREQPGWELLTDVERESMDMIALKFSRIVSGKSLELQHWEDVVGYGKLAEEQCKPVQ